jgi:hypothetical protein
MDTLSDTATLTIVFRWGSGVHRRTAVSIPQGGEESKVSELHHARGDLVCAAITIGIHHLRDENG